MICLCVGVDLLRQNSITQQILTQYLQKRLNRAGGSVQQVGQPQLLLPAATGNDFPAAAGGGVGNGALQRNAAENPYAKEDVDDTVEDPQYYDQGQMITITISIF